MSKLLVGAILLTSMSAYAAESGRVRAAQGLEKILNDTELVRCKNEPAFAVKLSKVVKYNTGSCAKFNSKAIQSLWDLTGEVEDKIIFETDKNQKKTLVVVEDLKKLTGEITSIWDAGKNGTFTYQFSALLIERYIHRQKAELLRADLMSIECVTPRNEKVLSASIHSDSEQKSVVTQLNGAKSTKHTVDEVIFDINGTTLRKTTLYISTLNNNVLYIENLIKISGKFIGIGTFSTFVEKDIENLRCTVNGSGY